MSKVNYPIEGGCDCKKIRYQMINEPLIIHCCHCTWCQRETGTAFALNAMIEKDRVQILNQEPELIHTPSASGRGQKIFRCPDCKIAVWSHYSSEKINFIRVGTLDQARLFAPDVHIFMSTKQPWVILNPETPAFPEFYDPKKIWSNTSLERYKTL